MKKSILFIAFGMLLVSCGSNHQPNTVVVTQAPPQQQYQQQAPSNVQAQVADVPGFDVTGFASLLKTTSNPEAIQVALNAPNNSINNLDLDNDGNIDYLRVDQINNYTVQVVDELGNNPNQRTVIATLKINPQNNSYSIQGSPDYCGNTYVYNSQPGVTLGQVMFLNWLMSPHVVYHPTWGYHRYPRGYTVYRTRYSQPYIQERRVTKTTVTRTIPANKPSPSANSYSRTSVPTKVSTPPPAPRSSVSAPVQSQRSFQVNTKNTGGSIPNAFSRPAAATSRPASSSSSSSSSPSSSRSYGSSSWGSRSSSSSSSSRSSSSSSSSSRSSSSGRRR